MSHTEIKLYRPADFNPRVKMRDNHDRDQRRRPKSWVKKV